MHADITVLISSSPIESHPSTAIIEETLASIRYHLTDSPIFIMLDGIRPEQEAYKERYSEYIYNLVLHALKKEHNVRIVPFIKFTHQARMTMRTLDMVATPYLLFVEHDTPLMERTIDWDMLKAAICNGLTNHIRLHYDEQIHVDHQHLMCGKLTPWLIKTTQFHNRPYLTHTDWFRGLLAANFTPDSRTFIEDKVYSPVVCADWETYKLTVYDPEATERNMKRSRDLNGRGSESKYPLVF